MLHADCLRKVQEFTTKSTKYTKKYRFTLVGFVLFVVGNDASADLTTANCSVYFIIERYRLSFFFPCIQCVPWFLF
jgi:hypothetical protein